MEARLIQGNRIRQAWLGLWVAVCLCSASLPAMAGVPEDVPKGMQRYVIHIADGCAMEFVAKTGGRTGSNRGGNVPTGYFRHENYFLNHKNMRSFSFVLSCQPGNAWELCPELMKSRREHDPMMIVDTQQRDLKGLHPRYHTDAAIVTGTGVNPPRSRRLNLCMGDETRTILTRNGDFLLGYDPRGIVDTRGKPILRRSEQALPDVLAIIRSMRFVSDEKSDPPSQPQESGDGKN